MFSFMVMVARFFRGIWSALQDPEFRSLFIFVLILLISGTLFYNQVESWRLLDSFYFTITTLTTVGFGDFAPQTDLGKIFTIMYILSGVGTLLTFITLVAQHTKDTDIFQDFFTKKPKKKN